MKIEHVTDESSIKKHTKVSLSLNLGMVYKLYRKEGTPLGAEKILSAIMYYNFIPLSHLKMVYILPCCYAKLSEFFIGANYSSVASLVQMLLKVLKAAIFFPAPGNALLH